MTTMAALLGGVPMMIGGGAGSELRQPLGYTIVGGLFVSQVLTLYTTPVIYIYLDRLSNFLARAPPQRTGTTSDDHGTPEPKVLSTDVVAEAVAETRSGSLKYWSEWTDSEFLIP